jgi:hypothetical protein
MHARTSILEELSNRTRGLFPRRGRFLLDSKGGGDNEGSQRENLAQKQKSAGITLAGLGPWEAAAFSWKKRSGSIQ